MTMWTSVDGQDQRDVGAAALKVPRILALFWVIKVLTTGMGESASDYLAQWGLWVPGVLGGGGLAFALWLFRAARYDARIYWSTVTMVAVFGTVVADLWNPFAGGAFDIPLWQVATGCAVGLIMCFLAWYATEGTLSIHTINTRRREAFYWATVLLTFALGTAAGDWTAFGLGLGFGTSALVFGAAILVPGLLHRFSGLNAVAAFWLAYVLTRPLGASVVDWIGKEEPIGLGVGDLPVTLVSAALVVALVAYAWRTGADTPDRGTATSKA